MYINTKYKYYTIHNNTYVLIIIIIIIIIIITVEEKLLYSFYSDEYFSYSQSTYIGIPFITWDLKQFKKNTTE